MMPLKEKNRLKDGPKPKKKPKLMAERTNFMIWHHAKTEVIFKEIKRKNQGKFHQ
jgi:hypothetical protein